MVWMARSPVSSLGNNGQQVWNGGTVSAQIDDPLASASGQFPLAAPSGTPASQESPSPVGLRPWGLRTLAFSGRQADDGSLTVARYDHDQQVAVDAFGTPCSPVVTPLPTRHHPWMARTRPVARTGKTTFTRMSQLRQHDRSRPGR